MKSSAKGTILGLSAAASFGLAFFIVHHLNNQVPSSELGFFRGLVSVLILAPVAVTRWKTLKTKQGLWLWMRSFFGAIAVICLYWTLQHTHPGNAKVMADVAPAFASIIAFAIIKETVTLRQIAGIAIATFGVVSLYRPSGGVNFQVLIVGLIGALSAGFSLTALRQASQRFSPDFVVFCLSALLTPATLFFLDETWVIPRDLETSALVLIASLAALAAQMLMTRSYSHLPTVKAAILGMSGLIWTILFDFAFHRHLPANEDFFSYGLIGAGILLVQVTRR